MKRTMSNASKREKQPKRLELRVEALEERSLLATGITASLSAGVLKVTGTNFADTITMRQMNQQISIVGVAGSFNASQVSKIVIDGNNGSDTIKLDSEATAGQQVLSAHCFVYGGTGDDVIIGNVKSNWLFGEAGNDRIMAGDGHDFIDGGAGHDSLYGEGGLDQLFGDVGNDSLFGGEGADRLVGGDGNDSLFGGIGNDWLDGSRGADRLYGEAGKDRFYDDFITSVADFVPNEDALFFGHFGWFDMNVADAGVRTVARLGFQDFSLGRSDMLEIFLQVGRDSAVSPTEFNDLKAIVAAGQSTLAMPEYVHNLSDKVVNGDHANKWWTDGATPVDLGNLTANSSGLKLQRLVGKWFLGLDHPLAQNRDKDVTYSYMAAKGSLFVSGPSYTDIDQGGVGDCYYLVALAETAIQRPGILTVDQAQSMFIDNLDGTYTVRFYHNNGKREYVTVDMMLPVAPGTSKFRYANRDLGKYVTDPTNELWVALAEKAYAQLNESDWIGQNGRNSYQGLRNGFSGDAFTHVTGRKAAEDSSSNVLAFTTASEVVIRFMSGEMVGFGTFDSDPLGLMRDDVVKDHAYAMVGYNPQTLRFKLFNPHGVNAGAGEAGILNLTWTEMLRNFGSWDYTHG